MSQTLIDWDEEKEVMPWSYLIFSDKAKGTVIKPSPLIDSLRYEDPLYLQNAPARPHAIKDSSELKNMILTVQSWLKGDAGGSFYKNGCFCTWEALFRPLNNENKALFPERNSKKSILIPLWMSMGH